MLLHLEICQHPRPWECGNPEGISKECGKGGRPAFLAFHAFHTLSFPRPALEARFTTSQSPRRPVLRTGSTHHKRAPLSGLGFECTAQPLQKGAPFMTSTKKYTVIKV